MDLRCNQPRNDAFKCHICVCIHNIEKASTGFSFKRLGAEAFFAIIFIKSGTLHSGVRWRWWGSAQTAVIYLPPGGVHDKTPWLINAVDDGGLQGPIKASHIDLRLVIFRAEPV